MVRPVRGNICFPFICFTVAHHHCSRTNTFLIVVSLTSYAYFIFCLYADTPTFLCATDWVCGVALLFSCFYQHVCMYSSIRQMANIIHFVLRTCFCHIIVFVCSVRSQFSIDAILRKFNGMHRQSYMLYTLHGKWCIFVLPLFVCQSNCRSCAYHSDSKSARNTDKPFHSNVCRKLMANW